MAIELRATLPPVFVNGVPTPPVQFADPSPTLDELPPHVPSEPGKVSAFADFGHSSGRWVPIFIVNRSGTAFRLQLQDCRTYFMQERREPDGSWVRVEPHDYSGCGNSYDAMQIITPGRFAVLNGYQPRHGRAATVRYRLYSKQLELVTNEGAGWVSEADAREAQRDQMSIAFGSFEHCASVARGEVPLGPARAPLSDTRRYAIFILGTGRFDRRLTDEVLREVAHGNSDYAADARRVLEAREPSARPTDIP